MHCPSEMLDSARTGFRNGLDRNAEDLGDFSKLQSFSAKDQVLVLPGGQPSHRTLQSASALILEHVLFWAERRRPDRSVVKRHRSTVPARFVNLDVMKNGKQPALRLLNSLPTLKSLEHSKKGFLQKVIGLLGSPPQVEEVAD